MRTPELGIRGRAYWDATVAEFTFTEAEFAILTEVCRTMDVLDELADAVKREGTIIPGSRDQITVHPAITEARGQRIALHRLVSALNLPDESGKSIPTARQTSAKATAIAKWQPHQPARRSGN